MRPLARPRGPGRGFGSGQAGRPGRGGRPLCGPVSLPATDLVRREQRMHTSFGSTREDYGQAMAHLAAGDIPVEQLVETFPLGEALAAFDASISKATTKAILIP